MKIESAGVTWENAGSRPDLLARVVFWRCAFDETQPYETQYKECKAQLSQWSKWEYKARRPIVMQSKTSHGLKHTLDYRSRISVWRSLASSWQQAHQPFGCLARVAARSPRGLLLFPARSKRRERSRSVAPSRSFALQY